MTFEILRNHEPFMTVTCDDKNAHILMEEMCITLTQNCFDLSKWNVKPEEQPSVLKEAITSFMHTLGEQQ